MTLKRISIISAVLFLVAGSALADTAADAKVLLVRTFHFRHKDAEKATSIIKPLMSAEGTISIQPAANSLVITDRAENLRAISNALAQFDTPPQQFRLSLRLVVASRVEGGRLRASKELKDILPMLSATPSSYNSFDDLGEASVVGNEGDLGSVELHSGYRIDFRFGELDPESDSLKLTDFRISKLQGEQKDTLTPVFPRASLNIGIGQTRIIGAAKDPQSQRALLVVFAATR